jgi:hypothetical protein
LEDIEGVSIVGDRFVFSSEVLFASGRAELTAAGRQEISKVARILKDVTEDIPQNIDWVLQVDGHTDDQAILPGSRFQSNWELSQHGRCPWCYIWSPPSRCRRAGSQPMGSASISPSIQPIPVTHGRKTGGLS